MKYIPPKDNVSGGGVFSGPPAKYLFSAVKLKIRKTTMRGYQSDSDI
jgi:hypothetical protein